jgi:acetyl-CoA acyltransferase
MNSRRAAIVAGCRTPFARSGTVYRDLTALDLAKVCVRELVYRTELDPSEIDSVVMGQVVPSVKFPNLGREAALAAGVPKSVPAHTVNRACASANQAIADVVTSIQRGHAEVAIAGGRGSRPRWPTR